MADRAARLTGGRLLARNTAINLLGTGAPMLVALFALPPVIQGLGTERFGVLTVAWVLIGYFGVFDLGLGRALTQRIAEMLGTGEEGNIAGTSWTVLLLMTALGTLGGIILAVFSPWLTGELLHIPARLESEALTSFYLLAFSLPWVISTTGWRGILEAQQRFGLLNALRLPFSLLTYVGPLLVLPFSRSLVAVVAVLVAGRIVAWVAHLAIALRAMPQLRAGAAVRIAEVRPLVRFGGWMTVSNVVSPLMTYADRFFIGAVLSMTAVTFYVTPYELVTKLWLVPSALLSVFFPAFASSFRQRPERTAALFDRGLRAILVGLFPLTLLLVMFAREGLGLWLGSDFARISTPVLQWLAIGVFINSAAQVPFSLLQAAGRPDLTGKLHLLEIPLYGLVLWVLLGAFGINGAAMAWVLRVTVDALVLFAFSLRLLPRLASPLRRSFVLLSAAFLLIGLGTLPESVAVKCAVLLIVLGGFTVTVWRYLLLPDERSSLGGWLRIAYGSLGSSV